MNPTELTADRILNLGVVSDAQISPGGNRVAYCIAENGTPKGEKSPASRLWMYDVEAARSTQLTFGSHSDRQPRWAPCGESLSFLSDREQRGLAQLYLLEGGLSDARKLTDLPSGVRSHRWSPDGSHIALTALDHVPDQENDVRLFDTDQRFVRLYLCNAATGETLPVAHGDLQVWEYCWSPDGKAISAIVSNDPYEWGWYQARLVVIDLELGDVRTLYEPKRQIARPVWSPDGAKIAVVTSRWSDPGMTGGDVLTVDVADGTIHNLTAGEPRSHLTVDWHADSTVLVSFGLERARAQVSRITTERGSMPLWTGDAAINDYGGTYDSHSGRVALTMSTITQPPEVWTGGVPRDEAPMRLDPATRSNDTIKLPDSKLEWLSWTSTDGRTIEGFYLSPAPAGESGPPPMFTLVHGGPTSAATPAFPLGGPSAWLPFLIERGISVFVPNFRGSCGYGVEFAEANIGELGGMDLQDILSGIDHCIDLGLADAERLGIGGWSYGGYITAWAITQTDRFAAAVAGASITNWYSFHGGTNIPGFDGQFIGTSPDELDSPYSWTSPLFQCKNVSTPTLFVHGEQDDCCPVGQAYEMTRALRRRGVKVECAVYPREGHGFIEREHRRDMIERSVSWLVTHLGML